MAVATAAEKAAPGSKHNIEGSRQAYYDKIAKFHMAPLWEVLKDLVTPEPKTECRPALWKFSDVKKLMLEAGEVISAEEAERRVLVLENPANQSVSIAGQVPGETTPLADDAAHALATSQT